MEGDVVRARVLDVLASPADRLSAMSSVVDEDPEAAKSLLLEVGQRTDESPEILQMAGKQLARLLHRGVQITEFEMRDLSETTYLALCDWVPET